MKGGFNKILRNIVAGSNDTEFEKVSPSRKLPVSSLINESNAHAETDESDVPPRLEGAQGEACDL